MEDSRCEAQGAGELGAKPESKLGSLQDEISLSKGEPKGTAQDVGQSRRKDSGVSVSTFQSDTDPAPPNGSNAGDTDSTTKRLSSTEPSAATNGVPVSHEYEAGTNQTSIGSRPEEVSKIPALIFDLGDVLCNWTAPESLPIAPAMLHRFRKTRFWYEYDLGIITQEECYGRLAEQYGVSTSEIAEAFDTARDSLLPNNAVFEMIRGLKSRYRDSLKLYLMSNIPAAEWKALRENADFDWSLFAGFFTSNETHMCKPELRFYRHVLQEIGVKPSEVVLVDDNAENVLASRSLGIRSLRFTGQEDLEQFLKNIFHDPVERGFDFLKKNAKEMWSVTPQGREVRDNFAQLFLYEAVDDMDLVTMTFYERTWNYYIEKPIDTVETHPDDIDTTSLAMILLPHDIGKANDILDEVLRYTNGDGIIMTYFDNKRPRVDPIVCVNALRFFYKYSRGYSPALQPTKDWVSDVLFYRAYLDGTYYYPTGDVFLYLFSRLLTANPESDIYRRTASLLRERLQERIGTNGDALELAMRVIACLGMGIKNDVDLRKLESSQQVDGGWEVGWLCQTGKTSVKIGNRGLTTALAVKAIEMARKMG